MTKAGPYRRYGGLASTFPVVLGAAAALLAASPAAARYILIDSTPPTSIAYCAVGGPCAASNLGLSLPAAVQIPGQAPGETLEVKTLSPFDQLYIYGEGIVSFGRALPDDADVSDPATLGNTTFAAPGLADYGGALLDIGVVLYPNTDGGLHGLGIYWFLNNPADSVIALYLQNDPALGFCPSGSNACFAYGASGASWTDDVDPYLPPNAFVGFQGFTAGGFSADDLAGDDPHFQASIDFSGGVPEPDTWALLILGFAAAGAGLRRARAVSALAPSRL